MKNYIQNSLLLIVILLSAFLWQQCSGFPIITDSSSEDNSEIIKQSPSEEKPQKDFLEDYLQGQWFSYVASKNQGSKLIIENQTATFYKVNGYKTMPVVLQDKVTATHVFLKVGNHLLAYTLYKDGKTLILNTASLASALRVTAPTIYTKKLQVVPSINGTWISDDGSIRGTFTRNYFKLEKKVMGIYFDAVDGTYTAYKKSLLLKTQHIRDGSAWIKDTQYHGAEYVFAKDTLILTFERKISNDLAIQGNLVLRRK